MSESFPETGGSDDTPDEDKPSRVLAALIEFTACVGGAFDDVCSYSLIPGDSYLPFMPDEDEDCDEEDCSQVWVRVIGMGPTPQNTEGWDGQQCGFTMDIGLEVGIMRCMEIVPDGEAPTTTQMLSYAMLAMDDADTLMCAALACDVGISLEIGPWSPMGPLGGQFGGNWTMTLQV